MNYSLLIIILFYFFPEKLCWHIGRYMDLKNVSFSGYKRIEKLLCHNNVSKIGEKSLENILKTTLCFRKKDILINKITENCQNQTVTLYESNCIENLIHDFNKTFQRLPSLKWPSELNHEVSLSLRIVNDRDEFFYSGYISISETTTGRKTKDIFIKSDLNPNIVATLIYTITCDQNYYGSKCENFCKPMDKESGHYNCTESGQRVCLKGWKGMFCSEARCDNCSNGQCVGPDSCSCYRGWTGKNCEICQKAPGCMHGMCQNDTGVSNSSKPQLKAFTCSCKPGWGGQHCDIDLKHCTNHVGLCKNNGICHNYYGDHIKHYICQCAPGFSGRHCQLKTGDCYHDNNSLKNYLEPNSPPICRCYAGFSGSYCQINDTLQDQINSVTTYLRSDGYCVNSKEGYSCSCSNIHGGVCKCRFLKCLNEEVCIDNYLPNIKCSNFSNNNSMIEFSSNFGLENSSNVLQYINATQSVHENSTSFDFKNYSSSLVFIPLLLGILIVVAIKFRYKFRRKSRTSIKTIHNDLGINNSQIKNPVIFTEQTFLLNHRSLPTSFPTGSFANNLLSVQETKKNQINSGDVLQSNKFVEDFKFDLSNSNKENPIKNPPEISPNSHTEGLSINPPKNPVICNPNLLINNYKSISESKT